VTLTKRLTKGSRLTHAEMDANLDHLGLSENHSFTQSGSGATSTTVQNEIRRVIYPEHFGAVGDGSTNDTAAIVAAIAAVPTGGVLKFLGKDYKITSRLTINKAMTLEGSTQYVTSILCVGCSGLLIDEVNNVQIKNLEIAAAVRHTSTPNAFIGIEVDGNTTNRPFNHIYRDVYIDGFQYGYKAKWLWSAVFDNFRVSFGDFGMRVTDLSVANTIVNSLIKGSSASGSIGLDFDTADTEGQEGWCVSNSVIDAFEIGIRGSAATHVLINNCQIDHNLVYGIIIADDGGSPGNFGGNWTIINNYIAMEGAAGTAAIRSTNSISSTQNRGNHIAHNQLLVYSPNVCDYGILMLGSEAKFNNIIGNSISGFSQYDIRCIADGGGGDVVVGNTCLSAITNNIYSGKVISSNYTVGAVVYERARSYAQIGVQKITWDEAAPTNGTWSRGDWCMNVSATAGGTPGWVCTTGGTPGTWKAMASVAA
jgi:hypothetical protein